MGLLHLVQMAVEPVGSENIIQEFDRVWPILYGSYCMAEMKMSSDTRSSDRASETNRRAGQFALCYYKNISWELT